MTSTANIIINEATNKEHGLFMAMTEGTKAEVMAFRGDITYPVYIFKDGSSLEFKIQGYDVVRMKRAA